MKELVLIRHAETRMNAGEVFRGRVDVELNETGRRQAELLAGYLSRMKIDRLYTSPLKRALQTAEAIVQSHNITVQVEPGLTDLDYGEWQDLSLQEVKERYSRLYTQWLEHPERVQFPGGEGLEDTLKRGMAVVAGVGQYDGTIALVSHRVVIKVLVCALLGLDTSHFWNIKQDTCGVTIFACEATRNVLVRHNETCFLEVMGKAPLSDF